MGEPADIGHTHINQRNSITLPEKLMQVLELQKGSAVLFKQNRDGKVYICKAKVIEETNGT